MLATVACRAFTGNDLRDRRRRERMPRGLGDAPHVHREATPRRSVGQARQRARLRHVVYMDSEMWFEPYVDGYDQKGALWRNNIFWAAYRDRPVPDAKVAIYPFKREFIVGSARYDVQSGLPRCATCRGRDAGARMLVHQHGRGGQRFLHHAGDGQGGSVRQVS